MSDHPLSPILAADSKRAYDTITSAYAADPVERWLFPNDSDYATHFPGFVAAVADSAFRRSAAWQLEDSTAVALFLPPGTAPDAERIGASLIGAVAADKHREMFEVLGHMEAAHPTYPHWYLPWFAVESDKRGHGLGSRLLSACLEYIDVSELPIYLESPNPRSVPFYERHGFRVTGTVRSETCPPITLLLRDAVRSGR